MHFARLEVKNNSIPHQQEPSSLPGSHQRAISQWTQCPPMWAVRAQRSATPNHGLTTEPLETRKAAVHLISRKELASQRKTEKAIYKARTCPCNHKHNSTTDKMFLAIAFNKIPRRTEPWGPFSIHFTALKMNPPKRTKFCPRSCACCAWARLGAMFQSISRAETKIWDQLRSRKQTSLTIPEHNLSAQEVYCEKSEGSMKLSKLCDSFICLAQHATCSTPALKNATFFTEAANARFHLRKLPPRAPSRSVVHKAPARSRKKEFRTENSTFRGETETPVKREGCPNL